MNEMSDEELLKMYEDLKKYKQLIANIDTDFFFDFVDILLSRLKNETCLRCDEGKPAYCEKCFQEVIAWNAKLQGELNDENLRCAEFAMENYILKEKLRYKDLYG